MWSMDGPLDGTRVQGPSFPSSKSSHCIAQYQDKIIVTGGKGNTDTWVFDSLKLDNFR